MGYVPRLQIRERIVSITREDRFRSLDHGLLCKDVGILKCSATPWPGRPVVPQNSKAPTASYTSRTTTLSGFTDALSRSESAFFRPSREQACKPRTKVYSPSVVHHGWLSLPYSYSLFPIQLPTRLQFPTQSAAIFDELETIRSRREIASGRE
jgi:hypothetical protein